MNVPHPNRREVLLLAVAAEGGLALVALAAGWLLSCPPLAEMRVVGRDLAIALAATAPAVALFVLLMRRPVGPFVSLREVMLELVVPIFRGCTLPDLVVIAALAGLGEEMLFRGVLQTALAGWLGSGWLACALAAAAFGLAHPISTGYVVVAAGMGLYLGALVLATDNLLTAVVVHGLYDLIALAYLARKYGSQEAAAGAGLQN